MVKIIAQKQQLILDRIEAGFAVFENVGNIPLILLPNNIKEGDILSITQQENSTLITIENEFTVSRLEEMAKLRSSLEAPLDEEIKL